MIEVSQDRWHTVSVAIIVIMANTSVLWAGAIPRPFCVLTYLLLIKILWVSAISFFILKIRKRPLRLSDQVKVTQPARRVRGVCVRERIHRLCFRVILGF